MTSYSLTRLATADLDEIWEYVAQDNAPAADRLVAAFHDKFRLLARNPLLGERREDLSPTLRCFSMGSYVIYYQPYQSRVEIVRVLHGARNEKRLF